MNKLNLDRQIQDLVDGAPSDLGMQQAIVRAVAPVLKAVASKMQREEYFLVRGRDRGWLVTTLSNRTQPNLEKRAIYAFPTQGDARGFQKGDRGNLEVEAIPVTHILFQMLALREVDSVVFMDTPGNFERGTEIHRVNLQELVSRQLQEGARSRGVPPDIA
ncbi:MAG: hypothetical protein SW833_15190 [Cyanobacteriota bacterium]|nr:hypothetical protein [Cyanobacteriota bacterium]